MKIEFESKFINIECEMENNETTTFTQEFGYLITDSTVPTNVFSAKFKDIDQLDTHDPFFNYLG